MNSREAMLGAIAHEDQRVQYDGKDEDRIFKVAEALAEASVATLSSLGTYQDVLKQPVDENTADLMKEARYNTVYAFTIMQAAVSKMAWALRIDGDEAFSRAVEAFQKDEEPELSGL